MSNPSKTKKRRITKEKIKKGMMGSISILLCLLMTPFMSIALGLVEYARYQEVIELTEELFELAGISELSDYDTYLHNRFGVLATSQENDLNAGTNAYLEDNANVLGKQIKLDNVSINGSLPLSEADVLKRQIVDISELSATTAVLVHDLNLDVLIDKLSGITEFTDAMDTMNDLAELTDAMNKAVTAFDNLKIAVETLQTKISTAVSSVNTLATKLSDLYTKLGDNGIKMPENATPEEIAAAIVAFNDTYIADLKDVYKQANTVLTSFNDIKAQIETVKTNVETVIDAVNTAKSKLESTDTTNEFDENGNIADKATNSLEKVLEGMVTLVEDTLDDIKTTALDTAKSTLDSIKNELIESTGLAGLTTRYSAIVNGDYFKLPLSDVAKEDIKDLIQVAQEMYSTKSGDALKSFLKSKFTPSLNFSDLKGQIQGILDSAKQALVDEAGEKVSGLLSKLVNIVKALLDLNVFYNEDLNAFVTAGSSSGSGYQPFLQALGNLLSAAERFNTAGLDIKQAFEALKDIFVSIANLMKAIMDIAGNMVASIADLGKSAVTGDVRPLYERLLISGYMVHNLPSRVDFKYSMEGTRGLTGKGLTGFDYFEILTDAGYQEAVDENGNKIVGFQKMSSLINQMASGGGTNEMFVGAELEYIRAGTNSEIANQIFCFFDIFFLRLVLNLPTVFMDGEVGTLAASATIASWLVYIIYIVVEPFIDTILLVNGGAVQLVKGDCWLTATGIPKFIDELLEVAADQVLIDAIKNTGVESYTSENVSAVDSTTIENKDKPLGNDLLQFNYQTHMLMVLLVFVKPSTQINHLSRLMELEASKYYKDKGGSFVLSKAYSGVEVSADVVFNPFFDLGTDLGSNRYTQTVTY